MDKIPVGILGATGAVGQRFVQLLADHPWFEIAALTGSERTTGGVYRDVCRWVLDEDIPESIGEMSVRESDASLPARLLFSALPTRAAKSLEPVLAESGFVVCSNASAYRQDPDVPLIIPEVNGDHLALLERQKSNRGWRGLLVTSPNCTTTGLVMALKPLDQVFGVRQVFATTMQAVSGAGYPGVPYLDIIDNIIPNIPGEAEKIGQETQLLLGKFEDGKRMPAEIGLSIQTNRVPLFDGHTVNMSIKFERSPTPDEAIEVLREYRGSGGTAELHSAPEQPVLVRLEPDRPQPRRDRGASKGMSVTVGSIRPCPLLDLRMISVVHNTLRGAASGSILNAELLVSKGYL
ncbi:MAG: aspartate-semialdehyde dehydrogenase [Chloroflexota bacterium]|nr:MAG: aspartate-semialdehyde dehydrogenase [Chloroflexota bacterium]